MTNYLVHFRCAIPVRANNKGLARKKAMKQISSGAYGSEFELWVEEVDDEPAGKCPDCGRKIGANEKRCGRCSIGQNYA